MRRSDDLGMIGEPEIIVGAEIDHSMRLAVVGDGRARFRGRAQLRLVKLHRPRTRFHPARETRRCLKRIASFPRKKIAQTEIGRVVVHKKTAPNEKGRGYAGEEEKDRRSS